MLTVYFSKSVVEILQMSATFFWRSDQEVQKKGVHQKVRHFIILDIYWVSTTKAIHRASTKRNATTTQNTMLYALSHLWVFGFKMNKGSHSAHLSWWSVVHFLHPRILHLRHSCSCLSAISSSASSFASSLGFGGAVVLRVTGNFTTPHSFFVTQMNLHGKYGSSIL